MVAQMHLCPEYFSRQTLTKTYQQIIDHYLSFFYAFFQNRRGLQPQGAAAQILPLLHVLLKREAGKGPIKIPVHKKHVGAHFTRRVQMHLTGPLNGQIGQVQHASPEDFCGEAPKQMALP